MAIVDTPLGRFDVGSGQDVSEMLLDEIWRDRIYENEWVHISPGDIVIDCGAHVGFFTRYALGCGASQVFALEPDPENADLFERNLRAEIASGYVVLIRAAAWCSHGSLPLWRDPNHSVSSTLEPRAKDLCRPYEQRADVPTITLDSMPFTRGPDFIKLDIEGAEKQALIGARQTIGQYRPKIAASIYHLEHDAERIPALIRSFVPAYSCWGKARKTALLTCLSSQAAQKNSNPYSESSSTTADASVTAA